MFTDRGAVERGDQSQPTTNDPTAAIRPIVQKMYAGLGKEDRIAAFGSVMRQLTIPGIAEVLAQSHFSEKPTQRFMATRHFIRTLVNYGPDSEEGRKVIESVNKAHEHFRINPNSDEFQYVVYTMTHNLMDSVRKIGPASPTLKEERSLFQLLRRTAQKMGCDSISEDYDFFRRHNREFELKSWLKPSPESERVARSLLGAISSRIPAYLGSPFTKLLVATLDPEVIRALRIEDLKAKSFQKPPLRLRLLASSLNFAHHAKKGLER